MFHLDRARAGQLITVTQAGRQYRFQVVSKATFDRRHRLSARYFTTTGQPALALVSCTVKVVCKPVPPPPALTTPPAIHAARDERLGPLAAAHTEADNLRILRAVIETPAQRPESAISARAARILLTLRDCGQGRITVNPGGLA